MNIHGLPIANYSMHCRNSSLLHRIRFDVSSISKLLFTQNRQSREASTTHHFERVIRNEIDTVNAEKSAEAKRKLLNDEKVVPQSDPTIWLRNCEQDINEPIDGQSMGSIPGWLQGNLLRNGPGTFTMGQDEFKHLFDAPSVLHRFNIQNGKVKYQCKFLQSSTYQRNFAAQRIVVDEFGTRAGPDPCKTIFQKFSAIFTEDMTDNCMISLYPFRDRIYAMGETPFMYEVDSSNINTVGLVALNQYVNVVHNSSHPHVEEDGTVHMMGLTVSATGPKYSIIEFPNTKTGSEHPDVISEAQILAKVKTRWPFHPGYMHSFGITPNYYILVEQPLAVSLPAKLASKMNDKPLRNILKWYPDYPTIFYVISRKTNSVINKYEAEPFFYLHVINQYEDDGHLVMDICAYKDPNMIDCMFIESMKGAHENPQYASLFRSRSVRFVLPLNVTKTRDNLITLDNTETKAFWTSKGHIRVIPEILCKVGCETPRINYPLYLGKKYRYFYSISADVDAETSGSLIKTDTYRKSHQIWNEPGTFPCEPIFVPAPNAKSEDDGVVLTSILWANNEKKVALVVLDGKSFTEIARTEFTSPTPVPKCLHGWFTTT